jgi:lipopolysaccharide/colanic/teichoic acid biosynthesis glycosyltransferase
MQRFFDILLAGIAFIILLPLLLVIAVALRLTGEKKVFFYQHRVGKNRKSFKLYKFVTMLQSSPNIGTGTLTMKNDPRILPLGKILRKTKLNELPQLVNVLIGDMSLVGPRPQALVNFNAFPSYAQDFIIKIKPGLTGVGSIIFRCEEEMLSDQFGAVDLYSSVISPYKGEVEVWFVKNQSLRIFFLVIFVTLWVIIFPSSNIVWKVFKSLPEPPSLLSKKLKWGG